MVVAQELNFTRAAKRLNMSQPPLSNQIKDMEIDLGVQLFIRGKRRLQLTQEGALLLRRAEQILDLAEKTRSEIHSLTKALSGTLRLGLVEGRAPFLVSRWIKGFREEYPLVRFQLWNGSSDDVLERMNIGLLDLAIIASPYDSEHLAGIIVGKEPWVAMVPASHPLAVRHKEYKTISLADVADHPLIVPQRRSRKEAIWRWFDSIHREPDIICEMSNYTDAVALVEQGVGIAIFPQTTDTPNPNLISRIITNPAKYAEYVLAWDKKRTLPVIAEEFKNYVQDSMEEENGRAGQDDETEDAFTIPDGSELL